MINFHLTCRAVLHDLRVNSGRIRELVWGWSPAAPLTALNEQHRCVWLCCEINVCNITLCANAKSKSVSKSSLSIVSISLSVRSVTALALWVCAALWRHGVFYRRVTMHFCLVLFQNIKIPARKSREIKHTTR